MPNFVWSKDNAYGNTTQIPAVKQAKYLRWDLYMCDGYTSEHLFSKGS
jgi:hypothetical protein